MLTSVPSMVNYSYYEGTWTVLPNFSTLTPVKSGLNHNFDLSIRNIDTNYGFNWTASLHIPTAGTYTFYSASDDGSDLFIDGTLVVNNDGLHSYKEHSGSISLTSGPHSIQEEYFQGTLGQQLTVSYSGPGITKQAIPDSALTASSPGNYDVGLYGAVGDGTTDDSAASRRPSMMRRITPRWFSMREKLTSSIQGWLSIGR